MYLLPLFSIDPPTSVRSRNKHSINILNTETNLYPKYASLSMYKAFQSTGLFRWETTRKEKVTYLLARGSTKLRQPPASSSSVPLSSKLPQYVL